MIREYTLKPEPQNSKARYVFGAILGTAIIVVAVYLLVDKYRSALSVLIGLLIAAAVLIYTLYIASEYRYDITEDVDGVPVFVVRRRVGKNETVTCRVSLSSITDVRVLTAKERRAHKPDEGAAVYSYHPTLFPDRVHLVTVRSDYEKADIFIEATDEFVDLLLGYSRQQGKDDGFFA